MWFSKKKIIFFVVIYKSLCFTLYGSNKFDGTFFNEYFPNAAPSDPVNKDKDKQFNNMVVYGASKKNIVKMVSGAYKVNNNFLNTLVDEDESVSAGANAAPDSHEVFVADQTNSFNNLGSHGNKYSLLNKLSLAKNKSSFEVNKKSKISAEELLSLKYTKMGFIKESCVNKDTSLSVNKHNTLCDSWIEEEIKKEEISYGTNQGINEKNYEYTIDDDPIFMNSFEKKLEKSHVKNKLIYKEDYLFLNQDNTIFNSSFEEKIKKEEILYVNHQGINEKNDECTIEDDAIFLSTCEPKVENDVIEKK
jgi:hypothetical protein